MTCHNKGLCIPISLVQDSAMHSFITGLEQEFSLNFGIKNFVVMEDVCLCAWKKRLLWRWAGFASVGKFSADVAAFVDKIWKRDVSS